MMTKLVLGKFHHGLLVDPFNLFVVLFLESDDKTPPEP